jgi:hypothetical protein
MERDTEIFQKKNTERDTVYSAAGWSFGSA